MLRNTFNIKFMFTLNILILINKLTNLSNIISTYSSISHIHITILSSTKCKLFILFKFLTFFNRSFTSNNIIGKYMTINIKT